MQHTRHIITLMLWMLSIILLTNHSNPISQAYAQKYIAQEVGEYFNSEYKCLAENIYYEAAKEPYEGKLAVATVVLNRLNSVKYPKSICEIVYQKYKDTYQFSWVGEIHRPISDKYAWQECLIVAKKSITGETIHELLLQKKAMYYHNTSVNPAWKLKYITKIGNHIFYSD